MGEITYGQTMTNWCHSRIRITGPLLNKIGARRTKKTCNWGTSFHNLKSKIMYITSEEKEKLKPWLDKDWKDSTQPSPIAAS